MKEEELYGVFVRFQGWRTQEWTMEGEEDQTRTGTL
jgi:hypothetical protein